MQNNHNHENAGWWGEMGDFLQSSRQAWCGHLNNFVAQTLMLPESSGQIRAWADCFTVLQQVLPLVIAARADASSWILVFEFVLPRERGRRPDLVILAPGVILVLEFKQRSDVCQADLDQASAYARDIQHYHAASHNLPVLAILVPTKQTDTSQKLANVIVSGPGGLANTLLSLVAPQGTTCPDAVVWLAADYAPLPSLTRAARDIFEHQPLPQIRRANSAGIPQALAALNQISADAEKHHQHHLALVTGVPGAGKTLVGLQFVYGSKHIDRADDRSAVFLSGNGPLVQVLQHALGSNAFVQDVHGFLQRYGGVAKRLPNEHIWVFDEAQRAWDSAKVKEKRGHDNSEPEDFIRLGQRMPKWAMLIGLIGEGQEIHTGEESGLAQWNTAIAASGGQWTVHCPGHIASTFPTMQLMTNDALNLTTSLRSHLAGELHAWIAGMLQNEETAKSLGVKVRAAGFDAYVTRNLDDVIGYVRERYQSELDKRYGFLASSKGKACIQYGINNSWDVTRRFRPGAWYNEPPDSPSSCCQLRDVATEFSCQGLELDFPIVAWNEDLLWQNGGWITPAQPRSKARDPHQLRVNSYRVLLTRGRDGMAIFVPPETRFDPTFDTLRRFGFKELP